MADALLVLAVLVFLALAGFVAGFGFVVGYTLASGVARPRRGVSRRAPSGTVRRRPTPPIWFDGPPVPRPVGRNVKPPPSGSKLKPPRCCCGSAPATERRALTE